MKYEMIRIGLVGVMAGLCFVIVLWFWYLQRRTARTELVTVNQLHQVLSDEEIQRKISSTDSLPSRPLPINEELALQAEGLQRAYGRTPVLAGVTLEVGLGSILCLAGANGSGKTTLLHLCATLLRPQAGSLKVLGFPLPEEREAARPHIGLVAHTSFLYPSLSLRENVRFYSGLYGVNPDAANTTRLVETFGLTPHLDKAVRLLSRGLLQRATLVRSLLHGPRLLLLDEPFTGLDTQGVATLLEELRRFRSQGCSALLTSHDLDRDLALCDRVAVLEGGRVVRNCPAAEYPR